MKTFILASSSPRRKELMEKSFIPFVISTSSIEEKIDPFQSPNTIVQSLAWQKAAAVLEKNEAAVVLGADTLVVCNDEILGKPKDKGDAHRMLALLSGKTHSVYTGVAILSKDKERIFSVQTKVTFWDLSKKEIEAYIRTKEPFDKAGAYGIQGIGATFVKEIAGDYFAVVGLPLGRVIRELKPFGIQPSYFHKQE